MKKRIHYSLLIVFCLVVLSCKFNPNFQGKGVDFVQGTWQEVDMPYQKQLLQHTRHHFRFTCDSFYVTLETHAKVNTYPDSCYNNGVWIEYAKGVYFNRNDTLVLKGTFTKSNFKQKISGCYRIGVYNPVFLIKGNRNSELMLQNLQNHVPVILRLKEKTSCVPKPLN
ncbi:MAG TPA: fumarate hydratase [Sphingobacteriaceae bacterium]